MIQVNLGRTLWCGFGSFSQRDKHPESFECLIDGSKEWSQNMRNRENF